MLFRQLHVREGADAGRQPWCPRRRVWARPRQSATAATRQVRLACGRRDAARPARAYADGRACVAFCVSSRGRRQPDGALCAIDRSQSARPVDALHGFRLEPGVGIDLGGIGKGYTVDRAVEAFGSGANVLVNAAGDLFAAGDCEESGGDGWIIGAHDPRTEQADETDIALLRVRDRAVATSGATKRRWRTPAGERYHHLIDTRTGRPFDSVLLTVTVVARTATAADVLAKTAYLLGAERGLDAVQRHGADALAVTTEGAVLTTPGMREYLL